LDTKINYTMVGFIVVALATFFGLFLLWWTSSFNRQVYNTYVVYMSDVAGLANQAPVRYNGVLVGKVNKIQLDTENPEQVIVYLRIVQGTPVTTSTVASLASQGITGVPYINLTAKAPNAPPLVALSGQPYPVIPSEPALMAQALQTVKEAATDFKEVSQSLKGIFDQQNTQNFKTILQNLSTASKQMPQMVTEIRQSAQQVSTLTSNVNQAMPSALELLDRLNAVSGNLETVTGEMKQNPSILVRGTNGPALGPGEQ
jgi:phospholipid/cholesterol/gamma-HCH transport system substrate-binding protein